VLIVEGEKAAEAASRLFPDWVCSTSGSATSAKSADWGPLKGRRVIIWPDADVPGRRYADELVRILNGAASSVAVVQVPTSFPEGWDLADPLPEGWDTDSLRGLLDAALPVEGKGPEPAEMPRHLKTWTAGQLLDVPVIPPRWVWDSWIPRAKVGMLTAVSDHGKTALALQLGAAIATGRDLFGFTTSEGGQGVLIVSFEDDAEEDLGPRLRLVIEGMSDLSECERAALRQNLRFSNPAWTGPDVFFKGLRSELEGELETMRQEGITPALIIVETLQAVMTGDENSPDATRSLWNCARAIAKLQDVTVAISHHHKKETQSGGNRADLYERMSPDRVRGSSANEGAARFILQLAAIRPDEAAAAGLNDQKALTKGYALLRASKLKAHKPPVLFLERVDQGEPGAHTWAARKDGDALIAALLKSKSLAAVLTQEEAVLVALWKHRETPSRELVCNEAFHGMDPKKAETALKNALANLRNKGLMSKDRGSLTLTLTGAERAQGLACRVVPSEGANAGLEGFFSEVSSTSDGSLADPIPAHPQLGWMAEHSRVSNHPSKPDDAVVVR
jgi:hypothetical protein